MPNDYVSPFLGLLTDLRATLYNRKLIVSLCRVWIVTRGVCNASDDRLAWLTGFNGSAGIALILKDKAALFV